MKPRPDNPTYVSDALRYVVIERDGSKQAWRATARFSSQAEAAIYRDKAFDETALHVPDFDCWVIEEDAE